MMVKLDNPDAFIEELNAEGFHAIYQVPATGNYANIFAPKNDTRMFIKRNYDGNVTMWETKPPLLCSIDSEGILIPLDLTRKDFVKALYKHLADEKSGSFGCMLLYILSGKTGRI